MKGSAQLLMSSNALLPTNKFAQQHTRRCAQEEAVEGMEVVALIDGNEAHSFSRKVEEIEVMVDVGKTQGSNVDKFRRTPVNLYQSSIVRKFQGNHVTMFQGNNVTL